MREGGRREEVTTKIARISVGLFLTVSGSDRDATLLLGRGLCRRIVCLLSWRNT